MIEPHVDDIRVAYFEGDSAAEVMQAVTDWTRRNESTVDISTLHYESHGPDHDFRFLIAVHFYGGGPVGV